jgi:hypothetical protein
VEIGYVTLRPAPGFSTVIFRNSNPDGLHMHDYTIDFSKGQPNLATIGIDFGCTCIEMRDIANGMKELPIGEK